jgi:hypothetical protein
VCGQYSVLIPVSDDMDFWFIKLPKNVEGNRDTGAWSSTEESHSSPGVKEG